MIDKTGKAYENLTQVIFQSVIDQKQFPNLKIERNLILQGKTTSHQIDVYWKFEVGGVPHEVIVQAKDWGTPVNKGQLLQFKEVLDDLPGQPKGVFVTRSGYQKGAKDYALAHGIVLYELKEWEPPPPVGITAGGWAKLSLVYMPLHGAVKVEGEEFNTENLFAWGVTYDVCTPHFSEINFEVSTSWLKQEYHSKDLSNVERLDRLSTPLAEMTLHNQEGTDTSNLQTLFSQFAAAMKEEGIDQKRVSHVFSEPTFIRVASATIPCFKINSVSVSVKIEHLHQTQRLKMSNFSQLVLHELNRDRTLFFATTSSMPAVLPSKGGH
jgi:hypothetical protein